MNKLIVLFIMMMTSPAFAEDWGSALGKACMNKDVTVDLCKQAQEASKIIERKANAFIKEYKVQDPAAVLAFSLHVLNKRQLEIPLIPSREFKNVLAVSPDKVYLSVSWNWR